MNYPGINKDDVTFSPQVKASNRVIVAVDGHGVYFGYCLHGLNKWSIQGYTGDRKITEWWPMPIFGTGNVLMESE